MSDVPLWAQVLCLAGLILLSAFFSMTETALMAINRHRLRHLAKRGNKLAITTLWLLERVNKLLSVILIANTLINALVTALVTSLAIEAFGNEDKVITIATAIVAFLLIVFAEIAPKVIGATYPERISLPASIILRPLIAIGQPVPFAHRHQQTSCRASIVSRRATFHCIGRWQFHSAKTQEHFA
jgi:Mg2+/Co2+ transporter CorB